MERCEWTWLRWREGVCALAETGLGSRSQASAGGHSQRASLLIPELFLIWEVWVGLENCFSNSFPGNADAAGLGPGLWEHRGTEVQYV